MPIFDTFSKRQKKLRGEFSDVYTYDKIHTPLRIQICHIWKQCMGKAEKQYMGKNEIYEALHRALAAEFGLFSLTNGRHDDALALIDFFTNSASTEQALDMIELSFKFVIIANQKRDWINAWDVEITAVQAIDELNCRFLEHAIGYTFVSGQAAQLIRRDNEVLHSGAVLPALRLLHEEGFSGANAEYLRAHEHYRKGAKKECLNECLKAFESTMKTVCAKKQWQYKPTDTASSLIDICLKNGLLPNFMQTQLGSLKSILESGIPTVRNKLGGHGQGPEPKDVPEYYAEYLLNQTAATILFLVEAYKTQK